MTWIDRLAIVWAIFMFCFLAVYATPTPDAAVMVKFLLWVAGAPWAVLRGLRWVVVGGSDGY